MKRSRHVTLVLLGTTALAGCNDDRTAPPQPSPREFSESLALPIQKPRCDRPEDFPLPECHEPGPQTAPYAGTGKAATASGGHIGGGVFWFFHGGGSSYGPATSAAHAYASAGSAVRAAAPAGTTSFGGFGGAGRASASFGGGA
ncbi:hypothetical protein MKK75_03030 [Methylobacterium sp. J-030]|uniref:hypothetical protein n=1 Tax=Methylobacterium sp. J-030 TaxID=2836627 RepID=UPI001FBB16E7|nr:hypothetical protein [Methylobacterium sp. J-030]MCJ2067789.1 hypothetical protein [Methylobacterium sp. J-030]